MVYGGLFKGPKDLQSVFQRMTLNAASVFNQRWPQKAWVQEFSFLQGVEFDMFAAKGQKALEVPNINRMPKLRLFYTQPCEQEYRTTENAMILACFGTCLSSQLSGFKHVQTLKLSNLDVEHSQEPPGRRTRWDPQTAV